MPPWVAVLLLWFGVSADPVGAYALANTRPLLNLCLGQAHLRGGGPAEPRRERAQTAEEGVLCRLKKGGIDFELLCHSSKIAAFHAGTASQNDVLITAEVFKDVKKGDRASLSDIEKAFAHTDMEKVVSEMLLKGDFQLSTAERKKKTEEKRAQIIAFIAQNYMEPKTYLPIPRTRIENGIESIKGLKIDPFRSEKTQAEELVKRLKDLFPLVKNEVFGKLSIPLHLAASISSSLRASNACSILKEQWGEEAYEANVSWMANDYDSLVAHLKRCTGGQFELKHDMTDVTPLKSLHSAETEGTKTGSKKASKRQTDRARGRERDDKVRSLSAGAVG